jgi:hypothetical protein
VSASLLGVAALIIAFTAMRSRFSPR